MAERLLGILRSDEEIKVVNGAVWAVGKFDKRKWIRDTWREAMKDPKCDITRVTNTRTTICYGIGSCRNSKPGIAVCHPEDRPNAEKGIAIAYCRFNGREIPKEILED